MLERNIYPAHIEAGNLFTHRWKGQEQIGRHLLCLVCNVQNNTRNRNGDARFARAHRRCSPIR